MNGGRLRMLGTAETAPLPTFEAAQDEFRAEWRTAREAHIDLMAHVAGHWVTLLHKSNGRPIKAAEIRYARREAREVADKALALVAALDACDRVSTRYVEGRKGGR